MRTTLDLPDDLFRRLKAEAATEGVALKVLIARYVTAGLAGGHGRRADQVPEAEGPTQVELSAHDLMRDGCGLVNGGVPDLSTNPVHMDGFGE